MFYSHFILAIYRVFCLNVTHFRRKYVSGSCPEMTLWVKMKETLFWFAEVQTDMDLLKTQLGQFKCMHSCHSLQFIFSKILQAKEKVKRGYEI